jgi:hypothetical protein
MELRREWLPPGASIDDVHGIVRPLAARRGVDLERVGVALHRVSGRRVPVVGRGNGELEQVADLLRNAGCEVQRVVAVAAPLPQADVVLVDLWSDAEAAAQAEGVLVGRGRAGDRAARVGGDGRFAPEGSRGARARRGAAAGPAGAVRRAMGRGRTGG